jgi:hypothetical protein
MDVRLSAFLTPKAMRKYALFYFPLYIVPLILYTGISFTGGFSSLLTTRRR